MDQPPGPIRALIDANLLVSALISADPERSAAAAVLLWAIRGEFVPVVPPEALEEVARIVAEKPWLASRIAPQRVDELRREVEFAAEVPQRLEHPLPRICRDSGDDYLIAHAILAHVDFLTTRDRDLLDLERVDAVQIVDPVAFLARLRSLSGEAGAG